MLGLNVFILWHLWNKRPRDLVGDSLFFKKDTELHKKREAEDVSEHEVHENHAALDHQPDLENLSASQLQSILNKASTDWEVLGVLPGSPPAAIKAAYRRLTKLLHPDHVKVSQGLRPEIRRQALMRVLAAKKNLLH